MESYNLLINGRDVKTGKCKYFIRAEDILKKPYLLIYLISKFSGLANFLSKTKLFFAKCEIASHKEVLLAISSAKAANKKIRDIDKDIRLAIVNDFREQLIRNKDKILDILVNEGHALSLAKFELDYLLENIITERNNKFLIDNLSPKKISENDFIVKEPYGVFGLVTPYNGPLIAASVVLISSILSGNACIVKPPSSYPISTCEVVKILNDSIAKFKAPAGWINLIIGNSKEIVEEWLSNNDVDGIIFFGASHHGLDIAARGLKRHKKVVLELSGSDAALIWSDANLNTAVEEIVKSRFIASGQFCIAIKRVFVHQDVYDKVVDLIFKKVEKLKIGLPSDPPTTEVPIGRLEMISKLKLILKDAKIKGAKILRGGQFMDYNDKINKRGFFLKPTVLVNVTSDMKVMQEEVFGPILPLVKINSLDEAMELINKSIFGLRASLWSNSKKVIEDFTKKVEVGSIIVNDSHYYMGLYSPHLGGVKASGIYGAKYFTEEMCYKKYIHRNI